MSNNISLTASMRSNLLSLQSISRQVSSTQNKLATGNKVNSAIDNPSSYYTARSLNNRANDLDALLDSMGQAVSTIKAATTALETGATFLEQAAAVATSALENATTSVTPNPPVNPDPPVTPDEPVTPPQNWVNLEDNADELIAQGYTAIDSSMSADEILDILSQDDAQVVLTEDIELDADINLSNNFILNGAGHKITISSGQFYLEGEGRIENLQIKDEGTTLELGQFALLNVDVEFNNGHIETEADVENIFLHGETDAIELLVMFEADDVNLNNITIDVTMHDDDSLAMVGISIYQSYYTANRYINLGNFDIRIRTNDKEVYGFMIEYDSGMNEGITITPPDDYYFNLSSSGTQEKFVCMATREIPTGFYDISDKVIETWQRGNSYVISSSSLSSYSLAAYDVAAVGEDDNRYEQYTEQFNQILRQYNDLIKDSSYKGANLLRGDKLGVRFNENGSANLTVEGQNMLSDALGLSTVNWGSQGDIEKSLQELTAAMQSIRAFTTELGNNYSIITSRQSFTENLINVLTEGADKLTLADMNEESANILALQTRQQLAINSLSLASQASQAVLKLF